MHYFNHRFLDESYCKILYNHILASGKGGQVSIKGEPLMICNEIESYLHAPIDGALMLVNVRNMSQVLRTFENGDEIVRYKQNGIETKFTFSFDGIPRNYYKRNISKRLPKNPETTENLETSETSQASKRMYIWEYNVWDRDIVVRHFLSFKFQGFQKIPVPKKIKQIGIISTPVIIFQQPIQKLPPPNPSPMPIPKSEPKPTTTAFTTTTTATHNISSHGSSTVQELSNFWPNSATGIICSRPIEDSFKFTTASRELFGENDRTDDFLFITSVSDIERDSSGFSEYGFYSRIIKEASVFVDSRLLTVNSTTTATTKQSSIPSLGDVKSWMIDQSHNSSSSCAHYPLIALSLPTLQFNIFKHKNKNNNNKSNLNINQPQLNQHSPLEQQFIQIQQPQQNQNINNINYININQHQQLCIQIQQPQQNQNINNNFISKYYNNNDIDNINCHINKKIKLF